MVSRKGLDPNLKQRITEPSITPAKLPHMPDHVMQVLKNAAVTYSKSCRGFL